LPHFDVGEITCPWGGNLVSNILALWILLLRSVAAGQA
jgi:hypothetical protein